ncbi:MAG: magnesium/cobalt transporter CorA [Bacteroidota bacterium]
MARFIKTKKEEIGLSPDAFHLRGKKKTDSVLLRLIDFDPDNLNELELKSISEALKYNNSKTTSWLNVDGLHDIEIMEEISKGFELDSLILSDVMNTDARPKIYEHGNCIYISIKMLQYDEQKDQVLSENLVIIVKEHLLISFQEKKGDVFDPLRERIRKNKIRIRTSGTDYLAFALIDIVFDNYSYIIGRIGEKIESLDEKLTKNTQTSILEEINRFRSEIIFIHKSINPCQDVIKNMLKMDSELINDKILVHIKELQENNIHAIDSLESYREILSNQHSIYHTTVSNKLNDIMKFLTVFSVIFIPLTFLAGVYGTNFDFLPETHLKYGYFYMWGVMIIIALIMVILFRRKKWL